MLKTGIDPDLRCQACGRTVPLDAGWFRCPNAGDGGDHLLCRQVIHPEDPAAREDLANRITARWDAGRPDSFDAFRDLLASCGMLGEIRFQHLLGGLQERLEALEGTGFRLTPLNPAPDLMRALGRPGRVWVKDETGNITGSHKGRHLMGTLLYLEALRIIQGWAERPHLAIYSCGNAALAASAVARAGGYALHAFVPDDVDPVVAEMLRSRGAHVERIARDVTGKGDPCYIAFRDALERKGWLPFACAGTDNWSHMEGGGTLGWETAMALRERGIGLDAVVLQVGGGALARAVSQGWLTLKRLGVVDTVPRIYACQPEGGYPFVRTYTLVLQAIAAGAGIGLDIAYDRAAPPHAALAQLKDQLAARADQVRAAADYARRHYHEPPVQTVLADLLHRRERYMWPWDGPAPRSIAHGILDDDTYDGFGLLQAMLMTGGRGVIVDEETLATAHDLARSATPIPVCPTGSAGLAGLIRLSREGDIPGHASVGLFFTGRERRAVPAAALSQSSTITKET